MSKPKKTKEILIGIFLITITFCIGIGIVVYGFKQKNTKEQKDSYYAQTEGCVVGWRVDEGDRNGEKDTYFSIVEYEVDGVFYQLYSDLGSERREEIGTIRSVRYDPENPQDSYLNDGILDYQFLIFFGGFFFGVPLIIVSMMLWAGEWPQFLVLSLVFGYIGAGAIYLGYQEIGMYHPFKSPVQLVGSLFLLFAALFAYGLIYNIIHRGETPNGLRYVPLSEPNREVLATVLEICPAEENEKEVFFQKTGEANTYYLYRTNSQGYFQEGKTYVIHRDGIEEEAPTVLRNGVLVYDLTPLQISWMDFVCCPAGVQTVEKVVKKVGTFYEDNREKLDNIAEKVQPAVQTAGKIYGGFVKVVFGLCMAGLGIISIRQGFLEQSRIREVGVRYESTEGVLVGSYIDSGENYENYGDILEYTVNGETYTVQSVYTAETEGEKGEVFTVKYNPQNPREAYLQRDILNQYIIVVVGLMILLVAFFVVGSVFEKLRKNFGYVVWSALFLIGSFVIYYQFSVSTKWKVESTVGMVIGLGLVLTAVIMLIRKLIRRKKAGSKGREEEEIL